MVTVDLSVAIKSFLANAACLCFSKILFVQFRQTYGFVLCDVTIHVPADILDILQHMLNEVFSAFFGLPMPEHSFEDPLTKMFGEAELCQLIRDRKSTRLNSSHSGESRMPSSA